MHLFTHSARAQGIVLHVADLRLALRNDDVPVHLLTIEDVAVLALALSYI